MRSRVRTHRPGMRHTRDASSKVREDQGMHRPRGASSKGRIVQRTQRPRNGTSETFYSGHIVRGHFFYHVFFPSVLAMMPPGDTLARRWRRLKKRCSFSSTGDNNKLVRSKSFTEQAGLEKNPVFFKPSPVVFLVFFGFLGFFGFFWFFYIFAQKIEFLRFFSFKNTFRCIKTLNYYHTY
jgi:hypothetical protein